MTKYININIDYLEDNIIWLEFKGYIDANIALQLLITWLTDVILVMYPVMILLLFQNLPEHSVFELSTYSYSCINWFQQKWSGSYTLLIYVTVSAANLLSYVVGPPIGKYQRGRNNSLTMMAGGKIRRQCSKTWVLSWCWHAVRREQRLRIIVENRSHLKLLGHTHTGVDYSSGEQG